MSSSPQLPTIRYNIAKPESGPVFVVGIWRSGTSLLYSLLNQHPDLGLMYESDLALMWPLFLRNRPKCDWLARWEFWNKAVTRHRLPPDVLAHPFPSAVQAAAHVCREYALQKGARIWGCKSPAYYRYLPKLAAEFPDARFIVIWRNPIGIYRSILNAANGSRYFRRRGMLVRALLGSADLKRGCDELQRSGVPLHQLRYEDLIREPEGQMRLICEFLRIPFKHGMACLDQADRSAIYDHEHHSLVKGNGIVVAGERHNPLHAKQERKIYRYIHWWREQASSTSLRFDADPAVSKPPRIERFLDAVLYRFLITYDETVLLIYSILPLKWLSAYRSFASKRKRPIKSRDTSLCTGA